MEGSVGKALRDARLRQKLTIEEAARGTKIRPARIVDLENDDYMHFPNLAYARSFLVLYAKYLRVDITQYPTVEVGSAVGTGDYQYLRGEEATVSKRLHHEPAGPPEKPRWLIGFFVFIVMAVLGVIAGLFFMQFLRLGSMENLVNKDAEVRKAEPVSPTPGPLHTPAPTPSATAAPSATATAAPTALPTVEPLAAVPLLPGAAEVTPVLPAEPAAPAAAAGAVTLEVRKAETVITGSSDAEILAQAAAEAAASATPAETPPAAAALPAADREIKIKTTRKTRIRLVRENPNSPAPNPANSSLYLGSVNPAQPPLVFKGKHFWIKTSDPGALKITIDGKPVTTFGPGNDVEFQ